MGEVPMQGPMSVGSSAGVGPSITEADVRRRRAYFIMVMVMVVLL